mmetsp:Transcript_33786/g.77188  ORF Transcript_33786/g.77188 Transcript_33786/m.77188 type:complete len:481 (+) Transcript_33786:242-1684(+)
MVFGCIINRNKKPRFIATRRLQLVLVLRLRSLVLLDLLGKGEGDRGALLQKLLEARQTAVAVHGDRLVLGVAVEKQDGGEALDVHLLRRVVGGGVHLSDHQGFDTLQVVAEPGPDGLQLLAVSAPGSIELDQDVLGLVVDDLIEGVGSHNLDRGILHRGDVLGLAVRLELASGVISERSQNVGLGDLGVGEGVLLQPGLLLLSRDRHHENGGAVGGGQAEEFHHSVVVVRNRNKHSGAKALGSSGGELAEKVLGGLSSLVIEEQDLSLDGAAENLARGLLRELGDEAQVVHAHELGDSLLVELTIELHGAGLVRQLLRAVHHKARGRRGFRGSQRSIVHNTERGLLVRGGKLEEHLGLIRLGTGEETNHSGGVFSGELVEGVRIRKSSRSGSKLLRNPGHNSVSGPAAGVFDGLAVHEPLQGRETLDTKSFTKRLMRVSINLGKSSPDVLLLEGGGGLSILGSEALAVSTPRRVELHEHV